MKKYISIKGARTHNLKNINLDIPKNTLTVITGLSGSGKSSLAFDTIYSEGQRRYVESLSAYARQFLDTFEKPDVDSIDGLSPAISIEQKTTSKNPRSTVGTITEIYDYLRLLYARIGIPYSPATGLPIEQQTVSMMVDKVLALPEGTKIHLNSPISTNKKGEYKKEIDEIRKKGFQRVKIDGTIYEIEDVPSLDKNIKHTLTVIVDRLVIKPDIAKRLSQSFETALQLSDGLAVVENLDNKEEILFSEKFACPVSGFAIEEIEPRLFSFNNPFGACKECNGLGFEDDFSEDLIIPDKTKSIVSAIAPWNTLMSGGYYRSMLESLCDHYGVKPNTPFIKLSKEFQKVVLFGSGEKKIKFKFESSNHVHNSNKPFEGVINNLKRRYAETESESSRESLNAYIIKKICHVCHGKRLNEKALQVKIDQLNIYDVTNFSVKKCHEWICSINDKLNKNQQIIAEKLIKEIRERLSFLNNVGIGYLNLSRRSGTLSGGETQRIRLASQIGSGLTGVLYVLDEPSIGLHQRDNDKLLETLNHLKNLDNTVIVVEHDEDTIRMADFLVDMGPRAGIHGGEVVAYGSPEEVMKNQNSITAKYLLGELKIEIPKTLRKGNGKTIKITGAKCNNLKNLTVEFPLGCFVCVTGVSGSGKSTLVNEILYKATAQHIYSSHDEPGEFDNIFGIENIDKVIEIDQSPIGKMPSSNPATYTKVFDAIREIYAELPESKARGYKSGRFSFNVKGGRCESCKGDGVIKIEMHFLSDVYITCDECKGTRYNRETLEIKWKDKSISDVLNMTITEASVFFANISTIYSKIKALNDVGLGYIKLGQQATTLSGGEAQRIKLAKELSKKSTGKTLYILDEPTTGLHFDDVNKLLHLLHTLVDQGNTAIIIEHNLDVIKTADYLIDMGPEGGEEGGYVIAKGTPKEISNVKNSPTGYYLKKFFK